MITKALRPNQISKQPMLTETNSTGPSAPPRALAAAMIVGPLLLVVVGAILPTVLKTEENEWFPALREHSSLAVLYVNLFTTAQVLLVCAWLHFARRCKDACSRTGFLGGCALAGGFMLNIFYNGVVWAESRAAIANHDNLFIEPFKQAFRTPTVASLGVALDIVGAVMLCAAMYRTRLLPRPQAVAIGVVGLFPLALIGGIRPVLVAVGIAAVVALAPTGFALLRPPVNVT